MSNLRKRNTPKKEKVVEEPCKEDSKKAPFWKSSRFIFSIGVTIGLVGMYAASTTPAAQNQFNVLQDYLMMQVADLDLQYLLPQTDVVDEFLANLTTKLRPTPATDIPFQPATDYKEEYNLKPHFPVVMIPGIVSSGLESWGTSEKSKKNFRKRIWGTMSMVRSVLLDKESWTEHLMLDPDTGLDPEGIKIRAVQGVEAADYFITGYWVWAKVIENLATIGYDTNSLYFASYDWRLSFSNLEVRDQYFSKLKTTIELSKKASGLKTVVVAHSMGSSMFPYFLKWVESPKGGDGGPSWTNDHIESFMDIAGPMMGVPKALTCMISGETHDTMALGSMGAYVLEKFFSRRERTKLMRSWMGGSSMLPKGGEAVWGTKESAPDDEKEEQYHSFGNMLSFVPHPKGMDQDSNEIPSTLEDPLISNYSASESLDLMLKNADLKYNNHLAANYSFGVTTSKRQLEINDNDPTKWSNPLESRLPNAPDMKIYCFYGIGVPTERTYYYAVANEEDEETCADGNHTTGCTHEVASEHQTEQPTEQPTTAFTHHPIPTKPVNLYIDASISDPIQRIETGIRFSDGDGTVPLLSLGYMCARNGAWQKHADLYNPAKIPIILKEFKHKISVSKLDVRGGKKASDHIDILGNWEMMLDLLQIVSGNGNNVTYRTYSDIESYADKVKLG